MDHRVVLGVAPTHRDDMSFRKSRAIFYKEAVFSKLESLGVEFVSIDDVCGDGLLVTNQDVEAAAKKFSDLGVHGLFVPFCDFGTEGAVAQLAARLRLPTLIWGPVDETGNGTDGDAQCGMAAAGKVLRWFRQPFTYIPTCRLDDALFEKGVRCFLAAANVVKHFRRCRVLQVGPRPESFWSVICNEGELISKLGVKIFPLTLSEIVSRTKEFMAGEPEKISEIVAGLHERCCVQVNEDVLKKSAGMKLALEAYAQESLSNCCAIQCWYALQQELGIWPCTAGALLAEAGFPVICETDVAGAITCLIATAAAMGRTTPMFGEWGFRHPTRENAEFVGHCGISAIDLYPGKPVIRTREHDFCANWGGHVSGRAMGDKIAFLRFEGDENGEYNMLMGYGKAIHDDSMMYRGACYWLEVPDIFQLENKIVKGPYIHHCAYMSEDILPAVNEALPYLGVKADFVYAEQKREVERHLLYEK